MVDAVEEAATDAAEQRGLQRYIWLYAVMFPIAATTASAVAMTIAALQGLQEHEEAPRLYALIILISFKIVASIGVAYLVTLGGASFFACLRILAKTYKAEKFTHSDEPAAEAHHERLTMERERNRTRYLAYATAVGAAMFLGLAVGAVSHDFAEAFGLLRSIAGS